MMSNLAMRSTTYSSILTLDSADFEVLRIYA